ncbi:MAG TPA: hypothetical protein DCO79_14170 [Spirochaeta sp.]|nr:hypothetical protein [Spirochaeta sp.]
MKKFLFLSFALLLIGLGVFAQGISLGDFPTGKWVDEKYNAVWEFGTGNIRILDMDGGVYYDFKDKTIENFNVSASLKGIKLSFSCVESGRSYEFLKPPTNLDLEMIIDTEWDVHYKANLPFKN